MLIGKKVRLQPNKTQTQDFFRFAGTNRFSWNESLAFYESVYKDNGEYATLSDMMKHLQDLKHNNPDYAWLNTVPEAITKQAIKDLLKAYRKFYKGRKVDIFDPKHPYKYKPKFKKKHGEQKSHHFSGLKVGDGFIKVPKLSPIKARIHRPIEGRITSITLSRTPSGKYYASILTDDGLAAPEPPKHIETAVGIDLGIASFVTDSNGAKVPNIKPMEKGLKKLKRLHRNVSRKQKGSANRAKARNILAKQYEKLEHVRDHYQHGISKAIVDENQAVIVEDLAVKGMMQHTKGKPVKREERNQSRRIADCGWRRFLSKLKYKAARAGIVYHEISRWEPSSKRCSVCGYVHRGLKLRDREWDCPQCASHPDRDFNAALNILRKGLMDLKSLGHTLAAGLSATAHGGCVRPA